MRDLQNINLNTVNKRIIRTISAAILLAVLVGTLFACSSSPDIPEAADSLDTASSETSELSEESSTSEALPDRVVNWVHFEQELMSQVPLRASNRQVAEILSGKKLEDFKKDGEIWSFLFTTEEHLLYREYSFSDPNAVNLIENAGYETFYSAFWSTASPIRQKLKFPDMDDPDKWKNDFYGNPDGYEWSLPQTDITITKDMETPREDLMHFTNCSVEFRVGSAFVIVTEKQMTRAECRLYSSINPQQIS